ncbi:MAG: alcohol dehydrogenase catalytic domain-containing protein, partial [Leifsonia sp.]
MRAVIVPEPGDADVLTLAEVPDPQPAEREVLIRVAAAGLNGADLAQRRGFYPPPPGAPSWPGLEVSGEITGLGAAVTEWSVGDRVCALL